MGSKITLKNAQEQEFTLEHPDNAGAVRIKSNEIANKQYVDDVAALKVALTEFVETNQSLSDNGYQKLPGGLIIQWGRLSGSSGNRVFTLPIAFPNSFRAATFSEASTAGTAAVTAQLRTFTSSNITIYVGSSNSLFVFAIGH